MGKAILPRDDTADDADDADYSDDEPSSVAKRDITGFDRALTFAEAALTKGPKVQLGTGREGSGVGIIVDNNQQAAARPGTGTATEAAATAAKKRDVSAPSAP